MSSSDPITKSGYCIKQGGSIQTWKKRYFVLRSNVLSYYKDEAAAQAKEWALGHIVLKEYSVKKVTNKDFCNKPHAYVLVPTDKKERVYLVSCENDSELDAWVDAIAKVSKGLMASGLLAGAGPSDEELKEMTKQMFVQGASGGRGSMEPEGGNAIGSYRGSVPVDGKGPSSAAGSSPRPTNQSPVPAQVPPQLHYWNYFFSEGFEGQGDHLAQTFYSNGLTEEDLDSIDHDLLKSMNISVAKTRITIMKRRDLWIAKKADGSLVIPPQSTASTTPQPSFTPASTPRGATNNNNNNNSTTTTSQTQSTTAAPGIKPNEAFFGRWKLDLERSDSPEPILKAQGLNTVLIKMAKTLRVQQEFKKVQGGAPEEILVILHIGKSIKIQTKTDHQAHQMDLDEYGAKSTTTCWWEANGDFMMIIDHQRKGCGPAIETTHRSIIEPDVMKIVVNYKTKDGEHDITVTRYFNRQ